MRFPVFNIVDERTGIGTKPKTPGWAAGGKKKKMKLV